MSSPQSRTPLAHPKYRPDIDGLRAIAVLAVIGFHAFPTLAVGGFVGVDIFFVISGYLISTIIFESLDGDSFRFWEFYGRRVRRIFPALSCVLVTCLLLGWLVLIAGEYRQLGRHVAGGATFVSNFTLWKESGYFDSVAEVKPLLHLWSLGIEEQFYIVWPLLLWCAHRFKAIRLPLIVIIAGMSFYLNLKYSDSNAVAAFYSPFARFWELLVGSILAYVSLAGRVRRATTGCNDVTGKAPGLPSSAMRESWLTDLLSWLGLALVIAALVVITKEKQFPGTWALLPTFGAAMIISSGPQSWVNRRLLSNRVLVWIGVISFPLYLWHWPLLSFAHIVENESPGLEARMIAVAIAFALAWLTYEVIEKPLRFGRRARLKVIALVVLMLLIGIVGVLIRKGYFHPRSYGNPVLQYFEFSGYPTPEFEYVDDKYGFGALGNRDARHKLLMLGDSHAQQYRNTFAALLATASAVSESRRAQVLYNLDYLDPDGLLEAARRIRDDKSIGRIVISNFWALTYGSDKINYAIRCCGTELGGTVGGDAHRGPLTEAQMRQIDEKFESASKLLVESGKQVYFVLDNPFGEELAPQSLVSRSFIGGVGVAIKPLPTRDAIQRSEPARSRIIGIARRSGAEIVDPFEFLCDADKCPSLSPDGMPIYKDYDHLSLNAVIHQVKYLDFLVKD